jgi:hypothetical protein
MVRGLAAGGASGGHLKNPVLRAADLLCSWSHQVDETHAEAGTAEGMRLLAGEVRAEYERLTTSPDARLAALTKAWALRELEALPRGPWRNWTRHGVPPVDLQILVSRLPEAVSNLVFEHVADELEDCDLCRRRAPCRLLSDGTRSGERDSRCAWGCAPREDDPATTAMLREWARELGL